MSNISIESQFLKYSTSMISDELDEIGINGAILVFQPKDMIMVE